MTYLKEENVSSWNMEQIALRKGLPNLYISMLKAMEGDHRFLDLQIMRKRKIEYWDNDRKIHEYIIVVDKTLNKYLTKLKKIYCSNTEHTFSAKYNDLKVGVRSTNKVFEASEIESMFINYIITFPYGFVEVLDGMFVTVPSIKNFKGENDEHSNNKLVKYIVSSFEKQVVLKRIHKEKDVKRLMVKGKTYFVKQNDLEEISYEDIILSQSSDDDDTVSFEELISENYSTYDYGKKKEYNYIINNYRDILTDKQLERFDLLVNAVETGQFEIDHLFHPIHKNQFNIEAVGKILFPDQDNNYRQPAVRNMLKSMKSRVNKDLKKQGFEEIEIRSDLAPFPMLPPKENKMFIDFNIGRKYIRKNYHINDLYEGIVKFYTDEQVIPLYELVELMTGKTTVAELIKKYHIDKKVARSLDGAVYTYIPDEFGEEVIKGKTFRLLEKKIVVKDGTSYRYIDLKNVENFNIIS
ncbi:hypothetical protein AN964_11535 [Heyndrickxia shackletonii]|uniref:Uncharacterized protein n=1 Tax=Heyndrickxia shackletonii TaxID=157838 RepID=A0A0Q3WY87_9BACI|nr:hypothetical protein [Heyndrickxia shackletonii]KQL54066.1 hypothetical protein AN964_11535 [Heyndrickxia shackletonii]NEY99387.1 hypothetical protein [Heyndrickxia shackletonii]